MKKILTGSLLLVIMILLCTGCEGDVTRAFRHEGFSVGGDFLCDPFYGKEATQKIKYLTGERIITTDGRIFEVSLGQKYSNGSNCKVADTNLKVVSIFDNRIIKADDGKLYLLNEENNTSAFTEVSTADNSYAIYVLLLGPEENVKAMTADGNNGIYYVLKTDGNVYGVTISKGDRDTAPSIVGSVLVYNSQDYGGTIVDFGYWGNNAATFVRTTNKVYRMRASNYDECSKYADIPCTYSMTEAPAFEQYQDYILAYNGSMIITTYKKTFSVQG